MSSPDSAGATCPSCGRFVGPLEQCPYCGATVHKRLPLRYIQIGAVLIALAGVAALLYAMSGAATPKVAIASIEATMNYAYVHLEGQVTRGPSYNSDTQTLTFYITDSTGEIQASSFRATTRDLIAQKKIPVAGDHVAVEGNLRVREDSVSFNLVSPDKLQITHPTAEKFNIGDISTDTNLKIISITGDVRDIHSPYKGLTLISVGDASGEVDVAVYSDVTALTGEIPVVQIGDSVQVNGTVTFYKDTPQLALTNSSDLVKLDTSSAPVTTTRIGDLDASRVGTRVSVQGDVADAKKFSQGLRVSLDDGSGTITVLLWSDTLTQITNADEIKKGAHMQALGKLNQYRGDLEVVPNRGSDVQVIAVSVAQNLETPATSQTLAPNETPTTAQTALPTAISKPTRTPTAVAVQRSIGSLTTADENKIVVVSGKIASTSTFSSGTRYKLDDGSGSITLILFSDVLSTVKNSSGPYRRCSCASDWQSQHL